MDWSTFQGWLLTGALGALCLVILDARRKLEEGQAKVEQGQATIDEKIDAIHKMMLTELRTIDVRVARIEAHIWPHQPRQ